MVVETDRAGLPLGALIKGGGISLGRAGFTGLASCEGVCNGCYDGSSNATNRSSSGGCLALEYNFRGKQCGCYSGAPTRNR